MLYSPIHGQRRSKQDQTGCVRLGSINKCHTRGNGTRKRLKLRITCQTVDQNATNPQIASRVVVSPITSRSVQCQPAPQAHMAAAAQGTVEAAIRALREGRPVAILDDRSREGETDLFFAAELTQAPQLRTLRTQAGGELYIAVGHEVWEAFGLPFAGAALHEAGSRWPVLSSMGKCDGEMCQGSCSVGISLDHRSTKTGAPDDERSLTVRRIAELFQEVQKQGLTVQEAGQKLGQEFHVPGHIFLCQENPRGLAARRGHTELSVALARAAGITPCVVGCVMLSNSGGDFGALAPDAAAAWAKEAGIVFVEGPAVAEHVLGAATVSNGAGYA